MESVLHSAALSTFPLTQPVLQGFCCFASFKAALGNLKPKMAAASGKWMKWFERQYPNYVTFVNKLQIPNKQHSGQSASTA